MKPETMDKPTWINEVYKLLCMSQRAENDKERHNLLGLAETMANGDFSYFDEGYSPQDAHEEELSYGN